VHVATNKLGEGDASPWETLANVTLGRWTPLSDLALALLGFDTWLGLALLIVEISVLYVHVYRRCIVKTGFDKKEAVSLSPGLISAVNSTELDCFAFALLLSI